MKKRIILVRHGRQNSNKCNVDVPLAPEGVLQAELLAKRLKGESFDIMYTSTLIRAIQTGDIITSIDNVAVNNMIELREYVYSKSPGDTVSINVSRGYVTRTFEVVLAKK